MRKLGTPKNLVVRETRRGRGRRGRVRWEHWKARSSVNKSDGGRNLEGSHDSERAQKSPQGDRRGKGGKKPIGADLIPGGKLWGIELTLQPNEQEGKSSRKREGQTQGIENDLVGHFSPRGCTRNHRKRTRSKKDAGSAR